MSVTGLQAWSSDKAGCDLVDALPEVTSSWTKAVEGPNGNFTL